MSEVSFILALGELIIAAAWVDGEVSNEEINCMKDLLFRLPGLTGREWATLEMYIDHPVGQAELDRLVEQLQAEMRSARDKTLALRMLDDLVSADGVVTKEEQDLLEDIKQKIESANVSLVGQLGRVLRSTLQRREDALTGAPNREEHFEDFIKNKVYYGIQRRLSKRGIEIEIEDNQLRKLSLAGGLMARIAHVDLEVTEEETASMIEALEDGWGVNPSEAAFITEIAVSEIGPDMDYYRLTREFFTSTTESERSEFLKVLFQVAHADGFVSNQEIEEIRTIANSLRLTHKAFINAKLTIPKDGRAS